jgi:hypothetical protein
LQHSPEFAVIYDQHGFLVLQRRTSPQQVSSAR